MANNIVPGYRNTARTGFQASRIEGGTARAAAHPGRGLNANEAARASARTTRIEQRIETNKADGPGYTKAERAADRFLLNQNSRSIRRMNLNGR
jgi:hypothetical protein